MRRSVAFIAGASIAFAAALPVVAGDFRVRQTDRHFSVVEIDARVSDEIEFVNDDKVAHNIFSRSIVQPFDLGAQRPGESLRIRLAGAGEMKIECAIHPKMRLTIRVVK
ncbi:MAG: methylamine utilization protein [Alphaproteobacteria bacterium]|nr:methylamine utilization protein [Alphaproteobacteria bacterium]